jgi:ABC-type amino acid transport system permease subunit
VREGTELQRLGELLDRAINAFTRQSDTRRAAIVGIGFGLLLCVIVMLMCVIIGFVAGLGEQV